MLKTHPGLNVNSVGDAQTLGLFHQRLSHVPATNDDQSSTRVLLENGGHGTQKGSVTFPSHETPDGQEKWGFGVRLPRQGGFICGIVGLAKRFVGELFLLVVVVHGPEHLVVNTVEHGFTDPILWRLIPLLKLPPRRLGNGHGDTGMIHACLFVFRIIAPGQKNGQVVRVLPRRRFVMTCG